MHNPCQEKNLEILTCIPMETESPRVAATATLEGGRLGGVHARAPAFQGEHQSGEQHAEMDECKRPGEPGRELIGRHVSARGRSIAPERGCPRNVIQATSNSTASS
jgi:hypothetical protein